MNDPIDITHLDLANLFATWRAQGHHPTRWLALQGDALQTLQSLSSSQLELRLWRCGVVPHAAQSMATLDVWVVTQSLEYLDSLVTADGGLAASQLSQ